MKTLFQARDKIRKLENELKELHLKAGFSCEHALCGSNCDDQQKLQSKTDEAIQTNVSFEVNNNSEETIAFVYVSWPSCDKIRKLPSDLTRMAVYLLRTQNKNIAKFAFKHPLIRAHLNTLIEKEIDKECQGMCRDTVKIPAIGEVHGTENPKSKRGLFSSMPSSRKRKLENVNVDIGRNQKYVKQDVRSIFKKTSKDDLSSFSFEEADAEMKERCPLFWSIIRAASKSTRKTEDNDIFWKTSVVTAAAVCLKNRSKRMTVVQLLISLIINHSSYTVS